MSKIRYAFAGDRDISVKILRFLLEQEAYPSVLLVSDPARASHAEELVLLCQPFLNDDMIFIGKAFRQPQVIKILSNMDLDYIIGVHFPYIIPPKILSIPKIGVLNLHPAYLPFNKGWHTPSWGILEQTPVGGTLHFMDEGVDTGDIVHQKQIEIHPMDTADSLYRRLKDVEFDVFVEAWEGLVTKTYTREEQKLSSGTFHHKKDLFNVDIQKIELNQPILASQLIDKIRGLTTNDLKEAAYFEKDGKRYRMQINILEEKIKPE